MPITVVNRSSAFYTIFSPFLVKTSRCDEQPSITELNHEGILDFRLEFNRCLRIPDRIENQ